MSGMVDIFVYAIYSNYIVLQNISPSLSTNIYNMVVMGGSFPASLSTVMYPKVKVIGKIPAFVWLGRSLL